MAFMESAILVLPLLQVGVLVFLVRALRLGQPLPSSGWGKALCSFGIAALPPLWQAGASFAFEADWRGARGGHWLAGVLDGQAGLVLVPFLLVAGVLFAQALQSKDIRRCWATPLAPLALWTAAVICLWYVAAVWFLEFTSPTGGREPLTELLILSAFPGVSGLNYAAAALMLRRLEVERAAPGRFLLGWWGSLAGALVAKLLLARSQWQALPVEEPERCFVVSAAAHGHPWLVGSWEHPELGKPVNLQWERYKRFEAALQARFPGAHRRLRRIYAHIGPPVAIAIQGRPWAADLVHLALRPGEVLVAALTRVLGR